MEKPRRRLRMLDGLRGLALIAVVAYHVAPSAVPGGFLGVEVFFVLSGYLLASLLLNEVKTTGEIDRTRFAYRRARRIVPALVVLLLGLVLLAPLLAPDDTHRLKGDVISSIAGLTNWRLIGDGNSYFSQVGRPPLVRHLWSIAIELQFYLLCPFLVGRLATRTRSKAIGFLAGGIAVSAGLMALLYQSPDPSRAYYGSETRVSALLSGVLLAFLMLHGRKAKRLARENAGRWADVLALAGLTGLGAFVLMGNETSRLMYPLGFLAVQGATLLVINGALHRRRAGRLLERPPLRWLGRRSYGIYLWHWPAVALLRPGLDVSLPGFVTAPLTVLIAVVLGTLSYRFVEGQVRRPFPVTGKESPGPSLRSSLAPLYRPVLRPAALFVLLIALIGLSAGLPTGDPIAASLREGEKVIAAQNPPPAAPAGKIASVPRVPAKPVLELTAVSAPPPPSPAPAAPRPDLRVTAIGDSVMVSAAGALQAKLGPQTFIDASLGRRNLDFVEVARKMREEGRLGDVVVVHLGNNGAVRASRIDALMVELAAVPHVVLVNVRVTKPWQDDVNRVLADALNRYPKIRLVDWFGRSGPHPDWLASDGTHLKPRGAGVFADLIAEALPPPPPPPPTLIVEPVPAVPGDPAVISLLAASPSPAPFVSPEARARAEARRPVFGPVPSFPLIPEVSKPAEPPSAALRAAASVARLLKL